MNARKTHLTKENRIQIEHMLDEGRSFKEISEVVEKAPSTISREIRKYRTEENRGGAWRLKNRCIHSRDCEKQYLCPHGQCKHTQPMKCAQCKNCNRMCPDYQEKKCKSVEHPPYVCNGCTEIAKCVLRKQFYRVKKAQEAYGKLLIESRSGFNTSEKELAQMNEILSPLIKQGQSIHHVMVSFPDQFMVSERTIYRYVRGRLFDAKAYHMPMIKRLKPHPVSSSSFKVDKKCRIGRDKTYYEQFLKDHPGILPVQMDSVLGPRGGKVLLTLHLLSCHVLLAFIRDRNDAHSVEQVFDHLYQSLGRVFFCKLFHVILTDNGSEFSNPGKLEFDSDGLRRSRIFYCDPQASNQKAEIESAHRMIRRILPKGHSFDHLSQADVDHTMSCINSYKRLSLNNQSPLDLFRLIYGQDVLSRLGLCLIPSEDIRLSPELFNH